MNENGGFTLVELLVVLLISSVVLALLGTLITFNVKSFNNSRDMMDIQYESQMAMNQLSEIFSEATYIEAMVISDGITETAYNLNDLDSLIDKCNIISVLVHCDVLESGTYLDKVNNISYDKNENKIFNEIDGESYELARNVNYIWIRPVNGSMSSANLFEINLELENNGKTINLIQQVKMRNKER